MSDFDEAGVALYALSYDEPEALADFAAASDITYTMLSDPDSEVIESFGILNTTIPTDDHPWYGIPFPGAYAIAADGTIAAKVFERNFGTRPDPDQLLQAALGHEIVHSSGTDVPDEVEVEVSFDDAVLPVGISREVVATFRVPAGQHLYGPPVPEGLVATTIELDDREGLVGLDLVAPPTAPMTLAGTGETLQIYEGDRVVLRRRVAQNGREIEKVDGVRWVTISGTVRWQACDDHACGLPSSQRFEFRVPSGPRVPADMGPMVGKVPAMNGARHFQKMKDRRR